MQPSPSGSRAGQRPAPRRLRLGGPLLIALLWRAAVAAAMIVVVGEVFVRVSRGETTSPVEIAPGVIGEKGAFGWLYAVRTAGGAILFDTGMDPKGRPIEAALTALGVSRGQVTDVFLSHGHVDEAAGVTAIPRARVHAGAFDVDLAGGGVPRRGIQRLIVPFLPRPSARVADAIRGEEMIAISGGEVVLAIPVPGHTAGSTAYLLRGILFLGDSADYHDGRLVPPSRWFSSDAAQGERSLAMLAARAASLSVRRICTGHDGCSPDGSGVALLAALGAGRP